MIRAKHWKIAQRRVVDSGFWKIKVCIVLIWRQPKPDDHIVNKTGFLENMLRKMFAKYASVSDVTICKFILFRISRLSK